MLLVLIAKKYIWCGIFIRLIHDLLHYDYFSISHIIYCLVLQNLCAPGMMVSSRVKVLNPAADGKD